MSDKALVPALRQLVREHGWDSVIAALPEVVERSGQAEEKLKDDLLWAIKAYGTRLRSVSFSRRSQEVYRLHHEGHTFVQIAKLYNISPSWAQTIHQQAVRQKERLEEKTLKLVGFTLSALERNFLRFGPELFERAVAAIEARGGRPPWDDEND